MGTKNNPGKFDCYHAAEPDEPMFILLARDPLAAKLVELWALLRDGRTYAARELTRDMIRATRAEKVFANAEKIAEARGCARAMEAWRSEQRVAEVSPVRHVDVADLSDEGRG